MFEKVSSKLPATPAQAFSVSEVNGIIADLLESSLPSFIWIEGEISNLSIAASGHRYLSLKDSYSTINCALFRGDARRISGELLTNLKNGDKVVVKANLSVYKPRGSYQLIISDIEVAGFGELTKKIAKLKAKLDKAGLTAAERKRPIPKWSCGIAVVTSETGAAIYDVLTTLNRRAPFIPVTVFPSLVQGEEAPNQLIKAIDKANESHDNDVILLVRGGGSMEDLMAFNDENVAMAVAGSLLPVVTGVAHETDFTIVDFVSDYRAATPTAAAEVVSPDKKNLLHSLGKQKNLLQQGINRNYNKCQERLKILKNRLYVQHPAQQLQQQSQLIDELDQRLQRLFTNKLYQQRQYLLHCHQQLSARNPWQKFKYSREQLNGIQNQLQHLMRQRLAKEKQNVINMQRNMRNFTYHINNRQQQLKGLKARLALLSPLGVLTRGYALAFDKNGHILRSTENIECGDSLTIHLADGKIKTIVNEKL